MQQTRTNGFRPIYVARFLAVSRICLFINFANLITYKSGYLHSGSKQKSFKKFCRGETDIVNASRPILKKEMDDCKAAGVQYIEMPVAYDALTIVVNPKKSGTFVRHLIKFTAKHNRGISMKKKGKVKFYNYTKGFGFIVDSSSKEEIFKNDKRRINCTNRESR